MYTISHYPPYYPLPSELLIPGTTTYIPIKDMTWFQFVILLEWGFHQLGYNVTRFKHSHDKGGDLLLEGYGERIIIQVKFRKEHTGTKALEEVNYARTMYSAIYGPMKARVISVSPFTIEAKKDAPTAGIELWDLDRLLTELRTHGIYYPSA